MAKKKKHPEHVNHERWLVSYADFITLLFAFFVVMFAVSQVDSKKVGRFTESFSKAVGIDFFPDRGSNVLPGGDTTTPMSPIGGEDVSTKLPPELEGLKAELSKMREKDELPPTMQVLTKRNELVIRLSENLLFESAEDTLADPRVEAVRALARQLKKRPVDVRVEGHTDNRPIHTTRFRSNWDLSTARATAVVGVFAGEGMPAPRLSAAGYGEFHPIAPNSTDDGRKQNRRVDIVVSMTPPPDPTEMNANEMQAADASAPSPSTSASASASAAASAPPSKTPDAHPAPSGHGAPDSHATSPNHEHEEHK